ncbi:acyltransferase family protein [Buttiauxella gaviniae]|uniref:acyltransferase family protein n=1 Tax=Buttiauxella gaviniae TaxID=82990 RepID=UPI003C757144
MPSQYVVTAWMIFLSFVAINILKLNAFSFIDSSESRGKNALDGMRCYLALGVVFHHFMSNYYYHLTGIWTAKVYPINNYMGGFGVTIFFMLSGYLFSSIEKNNITWWISFFIKRLSRIAPMCIFSSITCLLIASLIGNTSDIDFLSILLWLEPAVFNIKNDVFSIPNAYLLNSGVTWTLSWEWGLYFSLPLLSIFAPVKSRKTSSIILSMSLFICILILKITGHEKPMSICVFLFCFSFGFLCKHLKSEKISVVSNNHIMGIIIILMIFTFPFTGRSPEGPFVILQSLVFLMVCNGFTFFGALTHKGAIRLGVISYSIYLLHGIVWYVTFTYKPSLSTILPLSSLSFTLIILISCATYYLIESKFYNHGKKSARDFLQQSSKRIKNTI